MKTRIRMMNFFVDNLNRIETLELIDSFIQKRELVQHVVVNAGKAVIMQKDKKLREIVNKCKLINADGQAIVWGSKFLKRPLKERVTGIDLMYDVIDLAAKKGYRIYFFGARQEVVQEVTKIFQEKHPGLQVAGFRNGYFSEKENDGIVTNIRDSNADILFVAFSSPKKEFWLSRYQEELNVPFVMGVGGSFDVVAGVTTRAPKWMQEMGLEWFYRFLQEPRRMWKRYLIGNSKFIYYLMKERLHLQWNGVTEYVVEKPGNKRG